MKRVLICILTHGDEKIGIGVMKRICHLPVNPGRRIDFLIGNPKAALAYKRFIDTDLNRAFGDGIAIGYEHDRAQKIKSILKLYDLVIDIHSTTSGLKDALIITRNNVYTRQIVDIIKPKNVLIMKVTPYKSLIHHARLGVAFEYGHDKSPHACTKTARDIVRLLVAKEILHEHASKCRRTKVRIFYVYGKFGKQAGDRLRSSIQNYKLIRKGDIVGYDKSRTPIIAPYDFYPILFGENSYTQMFGFMARKNNCIDI